MDAKLVSQSGLVGFKRSAPYGKQIQEMLHKLECAHLLVIKVLLATATAIHC